MSYILDALRKADAERERGAVPGLHAQPLPAASRDEDREAREPAPPWVWFAAGVAVVAAGGVAWKWMENAPPQPMPPAIAVGMADAPAPAGPAAPQAPAAMPSAPPEPMSVATPAAAPRPAAAQRIDAQTRVYAQRDLPDDIRRELPALTVGGSIYSNVPGNRFLIVNGQILHEHDTIMPGLTLEEIKLKAAVLKFKGYRYGITF